MAISLQTVRTTNNRLSSVKGPHVALFVGATSGIGLGTLREFAQHAAEPRVYFVARNAKKASAITDDLRALNPRGKYEIIEKDVSLVKDATAVAELVKAKESTLDLLFLSVGFVSLDGRQDTAEGLEASMATRYYSRLRITQLLLPLLNQSKRSPHVVSVLAGGQEGALKEDDLGLAQANKNFSVMSAAVHSTTMGTLALEKLAAENPRVSFVHTYPGVVATPLLDRVATGFVGLLFRFLLAPLIRLFGRSAAEAGQLGLFYATSERYSVDGGLVSLSEAGGPLKKGTRSNGGQGIFLVGAGGDSVDNEKALVSLRKKDMERKVWEHTEGVFNSVG
ncbi:hypothetical protein PG985_011046 [Apiospora marii]|uniref:uncharacterized protein n=1 Tax=Apiospora marii TaxID=335849 RepID=UPI00312E0546